MVHKDEGPARLDEMLQEYTEEIRTLVYSILTRVEDRLAAATRMVYSNWNTTAIGYSSDGKARHSV